MEGLCHPPTHSSGSHYNSHFEEQRCEVNNNSSTGMALSLTSLHGATECACYYPHRHLLTGC